MKKLLALLLLSPLAFSQEPKFKTIDFALTCKVTDQVLIETKDGKAKRYSAYKDDLKIGDTFKITFKLVAVKEYYKLDIKAEALSVRSQISSDETTYSGVGNGVRYDVFPYDITLTEDYISLRGILGELVLKRYYKNDWDLMTSEGSSTGISRTLVANCMGMPKEFDEILELMAEIEGDKWFDDRINRD